MAEFNALQLEVSIATQKLDIGRQIAEVVHFIINSIYFYY